MAFTGEGAHEVSSSIEEHTGSHSRAEESSGQLISCLRGWRSAASHNYVKTDSREENIVLKGTAIRWTSLVLLVLLFILVPYFLFATQLEAWTANFLEATADMSVLIALFLTALLAVDIVLPIPNSLVSTAAGFFLGFVVGTLVAWIGNTTSCILGYWLGSRFGRPIANRLVGADELKRLEGSARRMGDWVIVISRAVPVMGEASVLFAGMSYMPVRRFLFVVVLSNLGMSAIYAAVGAFAAQVNTFLLAFFGAILVPAVAMLVTRRLR